MSKINKIKLSGTSYDIEDKNAPKSVEVTQAEYDALVSAGTVDINTFYIITDATPLNPSGYVQTSAITSAVTSASTNSQIPTAKAVYDAIPTGGTSITIDPSLDSGSTNPVANSAITTAIDAVSGAVPTQYVKKITQNSDGGVIRFYDVWKESGYDFAIYNFSINGKMALSKQNGTHLDTYNFSLVETSAVTSSMTSSSTDAQVPSAKCVYDQLGGLKLVKLTQSAYDALSPNYDSNTLYVIVN